MEELLLRLRSINASIKIDGNADLKLEFPKGIETKSILEEVKSRKKELIAFIKERKEFSGKIPLIRKAIDKPLYHLSSSQERLYFLYEMDRNSLAYNMPQFFEVEGALDVVKLEETFKKVIDRHEILRTSIIVDHEEACQEIVAEVRFAIEYFESDSETLECLIQGFIRPFDLKEPPLLRVGVVKLRSGSHILMIDMHHIITDGVSQGLLIRDFMTLYNGDRLPPLRLQYKDYSEWQQSDEYQLRLSGQRSFWENEFSGDLKVLELPTDFARPMTRSYHGKTASFSLSQEESVGLKYIGDSLGCTTFMTLLSVVNILLSKLSNQEDITIGTAVAGRYHGDMENILGMFVNTLALRNHADGEKGFKDFLGDVKKKTISCFDNQWFTYEALLSSLQLGRDTSRNPLFDVMFVHQNFERREISIPGLRLRPYHTSSYGVSKFDMTFIGSEQGGLLHFDVEYSTDLFTEGTIDRIIGYFRHLVKEIIADPHRKLKDLEIIPDGERHQLLHEFNNTTIDYPREKTIIDLFEEQVVKTPDNVSVCFNELEITYCDLNHWANYIAGKIADKASIKNRNVVLLLRPSPVMVAAILAVLKNGGVYVPLSPDTPHERIKHIFADCDASILITEQNLFVQGAINVSHVIIDEDAGSAPVFPNPKRTFIKNDILYVIYTSGSTGVPKGVVVKDSGIFNTVMFYKQLFRVNQNTRMSQVANFAFDAAAFEIWPCLLNGCSLHIAPPEIRLDVNAMYHWLIDHGIEITFQVTAVAEQLLKLEWSRPSQLRIMNIAGDKLKYVSTAVLPFRVFNLYGPTEDSIWTTWTELDFNEKRKNYIIGKPVANKKVIIVDGANHLAPMGVAGELCIAGAGLAQGYLNNDALTACKFIPSPIKGERMYKTGDLARWLPDGNLEFLGRIDNQVKVRGYRVELSEIEIQLSRHEKIRDVKVIAKEQGEDICLVAFYESEIDISVAELRHWLAKLLPGYMLPAYYVWLERIPLTTNGKVDQKKLLQIEIPLGSSYEPPHSATEIRLAEMWADVLGLQTQAIGATVNFFDIGGHSIRAVNLTNKIQKEFGVNLPLKDFFLHPTVRQQAAYITSYENKNSCYILPAPVKEYYTLSAAQRRLYFLYEFDRAALTYNMPQMVKLVGQLDEKSLTEAFEKLIDRHEILRTSFHRTDGRPVQKIEKDIVFKIERYASTEKNIEDLMQVFIRPFELNVAPLIRVGINKIHETLNVLMIDMHHIVTDGISQEILLHDFKTLYQGGKLPDLNIQYKDYAEWSESEEKQRSLIQQKDYWLSKFSASIPVLDLPTDFERNSKCTGEGDNVEIEFDERQTTKIRMFLRTRSVTLFSFLLACYNVLLSRISGQEDVIVGSPVANRSHHDIERLIGIFLNTMAFRNYPVRTKTFDTFLSEVSNEVFIAYENQDYHFENLVADLNLPRSSQRHPIFDVYFNLLNFEQEELREFAGLTVESCPFKHSVTKFDLSLYASERIDKIVLNLVYKTSLYNLSTISYLLTALKNFVLDVIEHPSRQIGDFEI